MSCGPIERELAFSYAYIWTLQTGRTYQEGAIAQYRDELETMSSWSLAHLDIVQLHLLDMYDLFGVSKCRHKRKQAHVQLDHNSSK